MKTYLIRGVSETHPWNETQVIERVHYDSASTNQSVCQSLAAHNQSVEEAKKNGWREATPEEIIQIEKDRREAESINLAQVEDLEKRMTEFALAFKNAEALLRRCWFR